MPNDSLLISVIGAATCDEKTYALAERVGRELALRGATVVCGGLGGCRKSSRGGNLVGLDLNYVP